MHDPLPHRSVLGFGPGPPVCRLGSIFSLARRGRPRRRAGVGFYDRDTLGETARLVRWLMPLSGQQ
jgi:hypothetical protein